MRKRLEGIGLLPGLLALLLAAACSDDAEPGSGSGDSGGDTDATSDVDAAPDTDDDVDPGDGGDDVDPGDGGGDVVPDQDDDPVADQGDDQGDGGGDDQGGDVLPDIGDDGGGGECLLDLSGVSFPETFSDGGEGTRPVQLILEAIDFVNDILYVRNVSDEGIDFDASWRIAVNTSSASLAAARTLPAQGRMRIHLRRSGTNTTTDTFLNLGGPTWNLQACGRDVVIQNAEGTGEPAGWSDEPENIAAYVWWGTGAFNNAATNTFADEAFDAGAWSEDYTASAAEGAVATCWGTAEDPPSACSGSPSCPDGPNDEAIVATGDVTNPEGWVPTDAGELGPCL